jgi:AraC-like DNA-binding protein
MKKGLYEAQWPKDNLHLSCYVHEIMNFRYHWHPSDFELNFLLNGQQYFCRRQESFLLREDDVILINPNDGHASYGQVNNTIALVLHFSSDALRGLVPKGKLLSFSACHSDSNTRYNKPYIRLREYASSLILALADGGPYAQYTARACIEMLIATLCNCFEPEIISTTPETDEKTQRVMSCIISYLEEHFSEKISLEDIAVLTNYNRTYISTLFRKYVGVGFYDYLMRLRLQHAIKDLVMTDMPLTDIALSNGFADLKTFNQRFRELLDCLPSEYRKNVLLTPDAMHYHDRRYIPCDEPKIRKKLLSFVR